MKYAYLTSNFLGSGAVLHDLARRADGHTLVGVFTSSRRHNVRYLRYVARNSGVRCALYYFAVGFLFRPIQQVMSLVCRPFSGKRISTIRAIGASQGVPVIPVGHLSPTDFASAIRQLGPDLLISVHFDRLVPSSVLAIPRWGGINLHPSLLPEFAGRAPIISALSAGRTILGVTVHFMNDMFDAGDIISQRSFPAAAGSSSSSVLSFHAQLLKVGLESLADVLDHLEIHGSISHQPQDAKLRTYYSEPANDAIRKLRAREWRLLRVREFIHICYRTMVAPVPAPPIEPSDR